MRFKAIELEQKPFITWLSTDEPLGALVVREEDVPDYIFGVCPWKIVDGELVARDSSEMELFEEEYLIKQRVDTQAQKIIDVNNATFTFGTNEFPMNEVARLHYSMIDKTRPESVLVTSLDGAVRIDTYQIDDFMEAYYDELKTLIEEEEEE